MRGAPTDFCREHLLTPTASFAINLFGEQGAWAMARFWTHKLFWLYARCRDRGDEPGWKWSDLELREYEEPLAVEPLYRASCARVRARIEQIRGLMPR